MLGLVLAIIGLVTSVAASIILFVGIIKLKKINKYLDLRIEESKEVK